MDRIVRMVISSRIYSLARETPVTPASNLSKRFNNTVLLKREDLQSVFSFKIRGAYNKILSLSESERLRGVICSSAGNHAQGVALSARKLGIRAVIVMPKTTPIIKVEAVKGYGAEVILSGDSYTEAHYYCMKLVKESGMIYIPPFDDELVIAGNGTIANELIRQIDRDIDFVFVPIGGGGLIAGIASFIKMVDPKVKIIGVQPKDSHAMYLSFREGRRITLDDVGIFADGVAVKSVGEITFEMVRKYVDDIILVSVDEICSAIKDVYYDTRNIVEPAGALGVAGFKKYVELHGMWGKTVVAINSGANMNFDRLSFVADRALIGEKQEALYVVELPERPGALKDFCRRVVGDRNVSEFDYRLTNREKAYVLLGLNIDYKSENNAFLEKARRAGFKMSDVTENEIAKSHIRYMVGGKAHIAENEVLYHFSFPERAGALLRFLENMKDNWNISLFHYKRHGGEFGRVLVGFEIPPGEMSEFRAFLDRLNYSYTEETGNPICNVFL